MSYKETAKRYILFIISLFFAALGVAVTKRGELGVSPIAVNTYAMRIIMVCAGTVILGFGISLAVIANVIMNSGEAFVKALSDKVHKEFGNIKIAFDVACVIVSVMLSLAFFREVRGAREGTIIAAICTGSVVKIFTRLLKPGLDKALK